TAPLKKKWSRQLGGAVSYPLIADGRVFVTVAGNGAGGYGSRLYALDQSTGATVWGPIAISGTYYFSATAYGGGRIYVINFDGLLFAYDAVTGVFDWSTKLPGYGFTAAPTAYKGHVYVGGAGTLYAVAESSGAVRWTDPVENGDG